jgi:hypothetical protein
MISKEAEKLLKEYKAINKEIDRLSEQSDKLKIRLNEIRFNCKVGQEIEFQGLKGIVSGFDYYWVAIKPYKKDGTPHKYTKILYNLKPTFDLG